MIRADQKICRNLDEALAREWLETNGLGGFASATIAGANTRRYHGLLTAATKPPVGRVVMLSKLEETLVIDGSRHDLSTNQYPGAVHPQGYQMQTGFRLDPFPVFTYNVSGVEVEKSVFMVAGENTTVIQYDFRLASEAVAVGKDLTLEIRPLIAFRDYHSTTHENNALNSNVEVEDGCARVALYPDLPALYVAFDNAELSKQGAWYRNFEYRVEQERGLDFHEDLFNPFTVTFKVDSGRLATGASVRLSIIASTERRHAKDADSYRTAEIERRAQVRSAAGSADEFGCALTVAADQFVVARGEQKTIVAGYHWFADWGRDTMIALPGLTLATGRFEIAKSVLLEFAQHVDQGMLPNRFPDAGEEPEYNTVDATLWFFEAVRALVQYSGDYDFVQRNLYRVLCDIIAWHVRGTRYQIHVDTDGLLFSGEPGVQLTWMDAKVGDWVVTPRTGKAVEIQALWYNALCVMEDFAGRFGDVVNQKSYKAMATRARASFNKVFWNEASDCLYDVVNGDERDASIRPNQIFAISLENSLVSNKRAKSIIRVVERELLTPRGLRTLSSNDSRYVRQYVGGPRQRDGAYHQGTVWAWLMGGYVSAYSKTFGAKAGVKFANKWLTRFAEHLNEECLGQVSEIFDAEPPHLPRGCIAQAWSVAELLRAAVECGATGHDPSEKNAQSKARVTSIAAGTS
ncbi:MAG TPA: amylo-alpha-1,6-glucosidase [Pyrinomonadaceae bacterium]|nr:amylo-alpha-1,6-glucosidase [Pyrinomonadaceae bacterium]